MFNYVPTNNIPDPGHINTVGDVLGIVLNVMMGVGVSISIIFIGIAGIRFVTSGGNPDNMEQAKKALTYSVVAMVLSVGAIAIKYIFLNSILGVDDPNLIDPAPPGI